jgi:aquaporin Z
MKAVGRQALEVQFGSRFTADWINPRHRVRRVLSELIGTGGLTFILSGGAAVLAKYGGADLAAYQYAFILSTVSALWLVAAVYFLGNISAHFNPAMTLAFALRKDMHWMMACVYIAAQLVAAAGGSVLARSFFGTGGKLAATVPPAGLEWPAVGFEAVLTFGMVLLVLSMANGPKLDSAFIPLAVGAYVMAAGTMGGPFDGAAFNPARAFGPDVARGDLTTYWVYPLGSLVGSVAAVLVATILRGPAGAQEAQAAMGTPLETAQSAGD